MELLACPPRLPLAVNPGRCLLFVYGQLQPGRREPRTASRAWPDRTRGELFDLGPYPAAVRVGNSSQSIFGFVLDVAESELTGDLDAYEGVEDGIYRRIRAVTEAGFNVWIYEYARPIPTSAVGPIDRWPPG